MGIFKTIQSHICKSKAFGNVLRHNVEVEQFNYSTISISAEDRNDLNDEGVVGEDADKKLTIIQANCGAKIEMSSSEDSSLTFLITGRPDAVLRAKGEVLDVFQTQANATIHIPKEHHRFILGKDGMKLQELEENTATKIAIRKASSKDVAIVIVGAEEGIDKDLNDIQIISDEKSKQASEKFEIPEIYNPFIQRANNCNTNAMLKKQDDACNNTHPVYVMKGGERNLTVGCVKY